jgi:hypothetical protein
MRSFHQDRLWTNIGKTRRFVRTGVTLSLQPWQYDEQKASDVIAALTTCQSMKPARKRHFIINRFLWCPEPVLAN